MTGPAAPPLPAGPDALMRRMRLPCLRKAAPGVLATARAQRREPAEVLRVLLAGEVTGRDAATRRMRRKTAGFPAGKTFSSWRNQESSIPGPAQDALVTLERTGRAENPVIAGPPGTGKSHLAEALAHAAIEKDLRVAWFTLETLTAALGRAKAGRSTARTVTRICRSDLIVVDDIGMLPAGQDAAEAFYRITDAAYERRSVAVTSNIHPGWLRFDHAQDPRHRHRRPASPPRPPDHHQGRLAPARRSPRRQGGDPARHLTPARRQNTRPPAWKTGGRQPAEDKATQPEFLMALDRRTGRGRTAGAVHRR